MAAKQPIQIGQYSIHENLPPFVIAEAGVHHFNSLELAKAYILNARLAGVHAIKFQTYKAERIAARWAPTYWDDGTDQTQYDIFLGRSLLTEADYRDLIAYANQVGVIFLSTPFDVESATMLNNLGMPAFKIASADITFKPLLMHIAQFQKPVLLSTGASTFDEIKVAVDLLQRFNIPVALLHCNLSYPTSLAAANLSRITALQTAFPDLVIGYSDHTQPQDSELACPLSVALGARIIEKHYTLNKALPDDDHYHAVDQEGLIRLVQNCHHAFKMTTNYEELQPSEQAAREYARRSIVAAHPLNQGSILTLDDIDFKRPGTGLSPFQVDAIIGKRLTRDLVADELVLWDVLENKE